jgi:hypothetical protein
MIFAQVRTIPAGTRIDPDYRIKGAGQSRGEEALVYLVPNRSGGNPTEKRIRKSEWEAAYKHLLNGGHITRGWFEQNLTDAYKDGSCSFRVTGEVLVMLGVAIRIDEAAGSKYIPAN